MYKCPKCGGNAHKERIDISNDDEELFRPLTGDIICDKCDYIGSQNEFHEISGAIKDEK